jgi:hypothetical protein
VPMWHLLTPEAICLHCAASTRGQTFSAPVFCPTMRPTRSAMRLHEWISRAFIPPCIPDSSSGVASLGPALRQLSRNPRGLFKPMVQTLCLRAMPRKRKQKCRENRRRGRVSDHCPPWRARVDSPQVGATTPPVCPRAVRFTNTWSRPRCANPLFLLRCFYRPIEVGVGMQVASDRD